jgi:hypothetical protein
MAQLNSWGEAVEVVRSADSQEIAECFQAMVEEHALSSRLVEVMRRAVACRETMPLQGISVSPPGEISEYIDDPEDMPGRPAPSRPPGPWAHRTRQLRIQDLSSVGELFLGTALCAYYEPSRARSPLYALRAQQWAATPATAAPERDHRTVPETPLQPTPQHLHTGNAVTHNVTTEVEQDVAPADRPQLSEEMPAVPRQEVLAGPQVQSSPAQSAERTGTPTQGTSLEELCEGAETRLGGLLYLVNLMEKLDLPDCFEESWGLATQIGSWALLELIGRALLEPLDEDFNADAIWRVLAQLDGREDGLPGVGFNGRSTWEIPATWADPAEHSNYVVSAHEPFESRLPRLEHAGLNRELLGWLNCAITYIHYRLSQALRLEGGAAIAEALLLMRGRVFVTRTHVDLVAGLEAASTRVRASGLDFDPGWSPRMGRIVLFHFG